LYERCSADSGAYPKRRWTISIVYLIRHGETEWNLDKRIQGQTDVPLNERGRLQAGALAERLAAVDLEAIYTSDLERARETAGIIAAKQSQRVPVEETSGFRECHYGRWEGLTREEVACRFGEDWGAWVNGGQLGRPTGGEDFASLARRAGRVFDEVVQGGKTALISAHQGPLRAILCHVLGLAPSFRSRFSLANCSLSALQCEPAQRPLLILLNDTCHLHGIAAPSVFGWNEGSGKSPEISSLTDS
jgi:broad specificity phosphatase PhoE